MEKKLRLKRFLGPRGISFYENTNSKGIKEKDTCNVPLAYYIGDMICTVGSKLLINLDQKVSLPNTEEIGITAFDIDTASHLLKNPWEEMKLGTDKDDLYRGHNYITLSKSKLISLPDVLDQYRYILDCYYLSLKRYFDNFNIETEGLNKSYEKLKGDDFFIAVTLGKNEKKRVGAALQKRDELNQTKWRLRVVDYDKNVLFEKHLKEFDYYGKRILNGEWIMFKEDELSFAGEFVSIDKWKKDIFHFTWGWPGLNSNIEYYEFSLKTMTLTKKETA